MVKVLVNGGLFEISKVEEIVEKRVPFNGTNIRLVQASCKWITLSGKEY